MAPAKADSGKDGCQQLSLLNEEAASLFQILVTHRNMEHFSVAPRLAFSGPTFSMTLKW